MPHWILLALGSALFAGLVPILAKRGVVGLDAATATALRSIVMTAFLAVVVSIRGGWTAAASSGVRAAAWIVASGLAGALSWLCYFGALEQGSAGGVAALDRTSIVFAVVLAALFLSEPLNVRSAAGAVLIAVGAVLVAWR